MSDDDAPAPVRRRRRRARPDAALRRPAEPIADPGLPEHQPRPTDVDPELEKRAERQVAAMFGLATLLIIAFCVCYFASARPRRRTRPSSASARPTSPSGCTLGLALLLIGIGAIQWAKKLMGDHEIIEYRHPPAPATRTARWPSPRS